MMVQHVTEDERRYEFLVKRGVVRRDRRRQTASHPSRDLLIALAVYSVVVTLSLFF